MNPRSDSPTEETDIDEMCSIEEFYRRGEEYLRETLRREKKVKYETGKRIIEGVRREYGEKCLHILTELNVEYDFLEREGEDSKAKMRELFKPLNDIKLAGRYVFKEVAENIDKIDSWYEGTFEVDYEYKSKKLEKEIERIRRENERQRSDAIRFIKKKYDLIEVMEEEKRKEEVKRIIERYCDGEREQRKCQRILDGIDKGSINIEDRRDFCSGNCYKKKKSNDPLLKATKKAIKANDYRSVAFLSRGCSLVSNFPIKSKNIYFSLFGYSCKVNSIDCAVYLLKMGGGIEQRFEGGETPLSESIRGGNEPVAGFLIERGSDIRVKDDRGHSMLHCAAVSNSYEIAKLLVENGADVDEKDNNGFTPLHWAAIWNSIGIAKVLIEKGSKIDEKTSNGSTPLHLAAENDSYEIAKLLIEKGANVDEKDKDGRTPLHKAALIDSIKVAKLLIEKGAKIDEKTSNGSTPLHYVTWKDSIEVAKLLIEKGANIKERDRERRTPLQLSKPNTQIRVILEELTNE